MLTKISFDLTVNKQGGMVIPTMIGIPVLGMSYTVDVAEVKGIPIDEKVWHMEVALEDNVISSSDILDGEFTEFKTYSSDDTLPVYIRNMEFFIDGEYISASSKHTMSVNCLFDQALLKI